MFRMTPEGHRRHQERIGREIERRDMGEPIREDKNAPKPLKSKPPKHGNTKTMVGNLKFDSKREAERWQELVLLEKAGKITELRRQVPFVLAEAVMLGGRCKPAIRYFCDAEYMQNNCLVVEDCKNEFLRKDAVYRIKKHLMKLIHGIEILET